MADTTFNPNELIIEKVRAVEEYSASTNELLRRFTQIEDPSLKTSSDNQDVTDAMGTPITTFYNNQQGTFEFTNSLYALDLAAAQYGAVKQVAGVTKGVEHILVPVSETLEVNGTDHTVVLTYEPVGAEGMEVDFVKVINKDNTFGKTYTVDKSSATGDKFTVSASDKKITLPDEVTEGRVFVNYTRKSTKAVSVEKKTDAVPESVKLLIHVIFRNVCDPTIKYAGVIVAERAQLDISSTEAGLKSDSKLGATYKLQKPYCSENAKLFDIIVAED